MNDNIQSEHQNEFVRSVPKDTLEKFQADADAVGGPYTIPADEIDAIGRTMFDLPNSKDNNVIVLTAPNNIDQIPSQALLKIVSKKRNGDVDREYVGIVVGGPFAEPDGLKADSSIMVTANVKGGILMPSYHGRANVEILGEVMKNGKLMPPRFRPLPNSPVFALSTSDTSDYLGLQHGIQLGLVLGYENLEFGIDPNKKLVLPRHVGILGTTGGGKSTTVSRLIDEFQKADIATIIFDTEGEYTEIMYPTEDATMLELLEDRGMQSKGVENIQILRLVGREGTNEDYRPQSEFSLSFDQLSPYTVMEILELNDAQQTRYLEAYDAVKYVLSKFNISPADDKEREEILELDELERGYPKLTLEQMYSVVCVIAHIQQYDSKKSKKSGDEEIEEKDYPFIKDKYFYQNRDKFISLIKAARSYSSSYVSWRAVQGKLSQLLRLNIFDNPSAVLPNYDELTQPGQVTIVDLSDTTSPQINNLVIAELLRGIQQQQDKNYSNTQDNNGEIRRVMVMIEEAHEFLSRQRIKQMPTLFEQVARIARRGRKRWLGMVFITQLPQHLPDEVLALINSYVLHKIGDANTISTLKRSIGGIDESMWERVRNLAPGQAVVRIEGVSRPLLVAIDPTPCRLRMID